MKKMHSFIIAIAFSVVLLTACNTAEQPNTVVEKEIQLATVDTPEYFLLRPEVEKLYGYSHAVKIGNDIKISGAVSMDDKGNLTAPGNLEQQMKNCYADLEKILQHYGCTFDDVV